MIYRITGPQSIARLDPLLRSICDGVDIVHIDASLDSTNACHRIDFVWETACELSWRKRHSNARVLNRLNNSTIVEDKSNLAFLQLRMECPVLKTFVALNVNHVLSWASSKWADKTKHFTDAQSTRDWWVVKASRGNGGRDVWIMNSQNYTRIVEEFGATEELVVQEYVYSPMLWNGMKFHFRAYTLLRADMSAYFYEKAFILTAGSLYDSDSTADITKHITNLSVNKRFEGHPGQVVCSLPEEYPLEFTQMQLLWKEIARACTPYMSQQSSIDHFEFFGIDVIADTEGSCWLVEINRLPGLESSKNNRLAEDVMYDEMMESLLRLALHSILPGIEDGNGWTKVHEGSQFQTTLSAHSSAEDLVPSQTSTWKNLMSWKAFTRCRENREKILLSSTSPNEVNACKLSLCGVSGCTKIQEGCPALRCSRCKQQSYCSKEHQKVHYQHHKLMCRPCSPNMATPPSSSSTKASSTTTPAQPAQVKPPSDGTEVRISRCMFCGESVELRSEDEAFEHMKSCPSLQEQLNGKDQFTIPAMLREKGIGLNDLHKV